MRQGRCGEGVLGVLGTTMANTSFLVLMVGTMGGIIMVGAKWRGTK